MHLQLTTSSQRYSCKKLQQDFPTAHGLFLYRCFLPDLTGFRNFHCIGSYFQHFLTAACLKKRQPPADCQPRYSRFRVTGHCYLPALAQHGYYSINCQVFYGLLLEGSINNGKTKFEALPSLTVICVEKGRYPSFTIFTLYLPGFIFTIL